MKTVCFFSGDITRCGGTERVSIMIANELYRTGKYQIAFLSLTEQNPEPFFPLEKAIRRFRLWDGAFSLKKNFFRVIIRLRKFLKSEKIDILINIDVFLELFSLPAGIGLSCRDIAWEHFHCHENLGCKSRDLARIFARHFSDTIVVLTNEDRMQYEAMHGHVPVYTITNPIPEITETEYRKIPSPFILSLGRLTYQKGFDQLPAVAAPILQKHPDWKWLIVGEGPDEELIREKIHQFHLEKQLILEGKQQPWSYYKNAEFLVMPSRFEGLGLVLLESLSQGCPAIAFDCKIGPSEIIQNGKNGFLVPSGDTERLQQQILQLMENPGLLQDLKKKAPDSLDAFQKEKIVLQWQKLLEPAIENQQS